MTTIHPSASDENFADLRQDPFFEVVVDLIADYLGDAFDDPAGGEVDRWTLGALPETGRSDERERLFTLSIGPLETLYVERFTEGGEIVDYRIAASASLSSLTAETSCTLDQLALRYPLLRCTPAGAGPARGDGVVIDWFVSDEGSDEQFFDLPLDRAVRRLAESLAGEGRGPYARQHNRAFAAHVLARVASDA